MTDRLTALSVDDEYLNLVLIEEMGKKIDLDIRSYTEPLEALDFLKNNPIDLIFVDYMMPGMDGLELIKKSREHYPDIPIVMITAVSSDNELKLKALEFGATDFLSKPLNLPEFSARVNNLKQLRQSQLLYKNWADVLQEEVEKATQNVMQREHETLQVLGSAAEYKDPETGEHILRVAHYSRIIAEQLTTDKDMQQEIFHAAPLHDIGKIGIPDTILLKPAKLSPEEFRIMKQHPTIGYEIMKSAQSTYLKTGAIIALSHHEKWDGSGYPRGLAKEEIPLCGRVLAVTDVFDALTSRRPYKEPWSFDQAVDHLKKEREKHFAPDAVDAFLSRLDEIEEIYKTYSE
ncbi:MAG TPA: response regulator [Sediminispirochaeta sp.]|nr:response regulator [Sediminispirochaeta sp.]